MHRDYPVNMNYPAWPAGIQFTSRFSMTHDCEICGKNGIKSGTFPVLAKTQSGEWVGMFVGNSCLKRMGMKQFKTIDQEAKKHANKDEVCPAVNMYSKTYAAMAEDATDVTPVSPEEIIPAVEEATPEVQEATPATPAAKTFSTDDGKTFTSRQGRYNYCKRTGASYL